MVKGYNVALKIDDKTIVGRTQDDLTIAANIKESQTKDDAGQKQFSVVGQEVTFRCSALLDVSGGDANSMDRDALIALALEVGEDAEFDVTYEADEGDEELMHTKQCRHWNADGASAVSAAERAISIMADRDIGVSFSSMTAV